MDIGSGVLKSSRFCEMYPCDKLEDLFSPALVANSSNAKETGETIPTLVINAEFWLRLFFFRENYETGIRRSR